MRQIICEKIRVLWHHLPESKQPIRARNSVWQSVNHCSFTRCGQLPSPAHTLTLSSGVSSVSGCNGRQTTTEQPSNEKTAHPSFVNNSLHNKVSKQKKTSEERQAKKKELDRTMLRGGALETSWSAEEREGEGPGSCTRSDFQSYRLHI